LVDDGDRFLTCTDLLQGSKLRKLFVKLGLEVE
jgi:hypothetical protein